MTEFMRHRGDISSFAGKVQHDIGSHAWRHTIAIGAIVRQFAAGIALRVQFASEHHRATSVNDQRTFDAFERVHRRANLTPFPG